jgi:PAS domain S-box-containing protein
MNNPAKTILIVEDEAIIAMQEMRTLEEEGYKVIYAGYGEEAIEIIKSGREEIDLILMDIDLGPGMDGTDAAREILKDHDIPVVFLSSHTEKQIVDRTEEITSYGYVHKNSGETVLTASVRMAFRLFDAYRNIQHQKMEIETANKKLNSTIRELHSAIETLKSTNEKFEVVNESLTRSQIELKKREERFRILLEQAPEAIVVYDIIPGRFTYANSQAEILFGITREQLMEKGPLYYCSVEQHDMHDEQIKEYYKQVSDGKTLIFERKFRNARGEDKYCEVHTVSLPSEDQKLVRISYIDITQRRLAEEKLRKNQAILQSMLNATPTGVGLLINRKFQNVNTSLCRITGYTAEEMIGMDTRMLYAGEDEYRRVGMELYEHMDRILPSEAETVLMRKDGVPINVQLCASPFNPDNFSEGVTVTVLDITESKRTLSALQESERRLSDIIQFFPDAVLIIDREGRITGWNRAMENLTGIKAEEVMGKGDYEYSLPFYGERRPILIDVAMQKGLSIDKKYTDFNRGENLITGAAYMPNLRGGRTYLFGTATALYNHQGEVVGAIESIRDITERRKTEEALRESERRLSDIIQFFPDAVLIIDREGRITGWNRAMENLTGIKAEEVMGKGDYEYSLPFYGERRPILIDLAMKTSESVEKSYVEFNRTGNLITGEAYMPNLRGGQAYLTGNATVLYNSQGEVTGAIESIRDITDRRRTEEAAGKLARSLEKINSAFLNLGPDYDTNIMRLTALCGELLGADYALYVIMKDGLLSVAGSWNMQEYAVTEIPAAGSICYDVINNLSDTAIVLTDLQMSSYAISDPRVRLLNIRSYLGHAVKCNHENTGSLSIMYRDNYRPTDDDIRIMGIISSAFSNEEDRRKTESTIKENIAMYRLLADNSFDVIWAMDLSLKFKYISPSVKRMTGWTPEEALDMSIKDFILPEYIPEFYYLIFEEITKPPEERQSSLIIEYKQYAKDGSILIIESTVSWTYDEKGNIIGIQGINRLINDRKAAEEALAKTLAEKEILLREIQHRMKNSLGIITGLISLEADHSDDPVIGDVCNKIKDRIMSLTKLYDMLYISKEIKDIWLNRYLNELVSSLFASYSNRKNFSLKTEMDNVRIDV